MTPRTWPFLLAEGVCKSFGGVPVLSDVTIGFERGSVHGLVGENGAGKSTLMKIVAGQYSGEGEVLVDGVIIRGGVAAAQKAQVAIVPQELASIPDLRVYENLFVGRELRSRLGLLDRPRMIRESTDLIGTFGVEIDPQALMRDLPVGLQQIVEIVKNSSRGARVLLLDEPTSAIAEREVDRLYDVVNQLREQGVAMLYTTHKMGEIRAIADRVVVLRDGGLVLDAAIDKVSDDDIVTAMIGRELEQLFPEKDAPTTQPVLELEDLLVHGASGPVSLTVHAGEVLSLAGLVGAGRTELIETIFGLRPALGGTIRMNGVELAKPSPRTAITSGMALVPEDRKGSGAVLSMSVLDNGSLTRLERYTASGWLLDGKRSREVSSAMKDVGLRSRGLKQHVGNLSGGNQQKVVFARWLTDKVHVLLLDEPTRGVDVGARSEIYRIIRDLAREGMAVLVASSDMIEVLGLSHRSLVMSKGCVVDELRADDLAAPDVQERIFRRASGQLRLAAVEPVPTEKSVSRTPHSPHNGRNVP